MLTDFLLSQVMRNASQHQRALYLKPLNDAMEAYAIDTALRAAAFLAQLAHESGEFRYMEEIWGPTEAQKRYEPPGKLAKALGNEKPGDGKRFKGRGPIQITGRANYKTCGDLLGIDLLSDPERAAAPDVGFRIAGLFWQRNGLNARADAGDFDGITRRINGGMNGAASRRAYYERALIVLAAAFPAGSARREKKGAATTQKPLRRGQEAIEQFAPRRPRPVPSQTPVCNARADSLDFRDLMYTPTLIEVPTHVPLNEYLAYHVPVLDQGSQGACTGFGLATVANYLLLRRRVIPDPVPVSPHMIYHLARRYDEWAGENYSGSSARGAMKGWHKHGICADQAWRSPGKLSDAIVTDAVRRPLGAYFRVNHKDLIAMHSAIAEVGVLYATCTVHQGWNRVGPDGFIEQDDALVGGHAFAIVAYDENGFWIQNSWGPTWGAGGFGRISYDDWLANGTDVWVARLGAPVLLRQPQSTAAAHSPASGQSAAYSYADLRPHIVSVGNDGLLKAGGNYGCTPQELAQVFTDDIPRVLGSWDTPRILLYAHGGLVGEDAAVQRLADYRPALMEGQVYPLSFIWRSDYWTTVTNILRDAVRRRRPEGMLDAAKDFMLDRLDDALEPVARALSGKAAWDEMKENALATGKGKGAAVLVADHLARLAKAFPKLEIHMVGHSAGSILLAPLTRLLGARGLRIETCTLWAPACTADLFRQYYVPAMEKAVLKRLAIFALTDAAERDDNCAEIYNKSLLYLVSDAFEKTLRIPVFRDTGVPILGMQRTLQGELAEVLAKHHVDLVYAPNTASTGSTEASGARHHGDFDDDGPTVSATLARILAGAAARAPARVAPRAGKARSTAAPAPRPATPRFRRSSRSLLEQRLRMDAVTKPEPR